MCLACRCCSMQMLHLGYRAETVCAVWGGTSCYWPWAHVVCTCPDQQQGLAVHPKGILWSIA